MRQLIFLMISSVLLTACAGTGRSIPSTISQTPVNDIQLTEVIKDPESFIGAQVRWGGSILSTQKHSDYLAVEILQRPLSSEGKPESRKHSDGRFIAHIAKPYDSGGYYRGRYVTVSGILITPQIKAINKQTTQTLPVITVNEHYTWNSYSRRYSHKTLYHYPFFHSHFYHGYHYPRFHRSYYLRHGFYGRHHLYFRGRRHYW